MLRSDSFDHNTFVCGTPIGVSGVVMGNRSLATVLVTGQVTITTRVGKKLQSLVLRDTLYVPALRRNLLSCLIALRPPQGLV